MYDATSVRKACGTRERHHSRLSPVLLAIAIGLAVMPGTGQVGAPIPIARFDSASHLAADPLGNLYVIDRGAGTLVRIGTAGTPAAVVGGAGSPVMDPVAVDPTNGMAVLVADGASGLIHRFNRSMVWTGELNVSDRTSRRRDAVSSDLAVREMARPRDVTSIASTRTRHLFVLDRSSRRIDVFDHRNDHLGTIGTFGAAEAVLSDPAYLCSFSG
jgi:hypothetical protein